MLVEIVANAECISVVGIKGGHYQILIKEEHRPYASFTCSKRTYQLRKLTPGLKNSYVTFQKCVDELLGDLYYALAYVDNIVIHSPDPMLHVKHIETVLCRLRSAGLKVQMDHCVWFDGKVSYLKYLIGNNCSLPEYFRVKAINDWPVPTEREQILVFLRLVDHFQGCINGYRDLVSPLKKLIRKARSVAMQWTRECNQSFECLKMLLITEPILQSANFAKPMIIQTAFSERGLSAILLQEDNNKFLHPLAYVARKLKEKERKYNSQEGNAYSILWTLHVFRIYGCTRKVVIQADKNAWTFLEKHRHRSPRLMQWYFRLQKYDFDVEHLPGKKALIAHCLSRMFSADARGENG